MLDPVTAIGLASAIVAFVDFGYKVVKGAAEMYNGVDGALGENMTREAVVKQMMSLSARLQSPDSSHMVGQDRALCVLSSECHKISSDLLRLLESLRPAKPNSKSHSLRASLKAKIKDSERRDLEKRLDSCRAQLALHLNFANIASVDKLSEYVRGNPEALSALQNQVSELSTLVCAMGLATQQLIATQRRSVDKILYDSILESLAFGGLRHREDNIMEAHDKTLQWIFDNTAREKHDSLLKKHAASPGDEYNGFYRHERGEITVEDSALRLQEQKKLLNWLSSGSGIFHVSGKMGAGKSTFMKFLGMHSETRKRLKEWAGEYELVVASFYFWRVGSPLQKSLAGLCRSLLHDVLKAHPDLIPDVFPDTWKTAVQASLTEQVRPEIREAEVREAFSRLVSNISLRTKHRFCFFIDGLDEYETTGSFDAADMANQLNAWTLASGNIKFCVSSREHNEFMGAFPSAQRLRLHEVTRLDIQLFVQERLSDYKSLDGYWDVVHSIVDKAAGVFIWVSTVVQRVRVQLRNEVPPDRLSELITDLPDELFKLYKHIISSMDKYTRRRLIQTLAMLQVGLPYGNACKYFHLRMYYFLDDFNMNENFARGESFDARLKSLREQVEEMDETARRRVAGWCQGLVQVTHYDQISYSHLSVQEFISEMPDVLEECRATAGINILSELNLAHFKLNAARVTKDTSILEFLIFNIEYMIVPLLKIRRRNHLDKPPFTYLKIIDDTLESLKPYSCIISGRKGKPCSSLADCPQALVDWVAYRNGYALSILVTWNKTAGPLYTVWKIENVPLATNIKIKTEILFLSAFASGGPISVLVLESLFQRNLITHETALERFRDENILGPLKVCMPNKSLTMWQYFLLNRVLVYTGQDFNLHSFYRTIELFLQSRADPRLWVTMKRPAQKKSYHADYIIPHILRLAADMKLPTDPEGLYVWKTGLWYYAGVTAHPQGGCSLIRNLSEGKNGRAGYLEDDEIDFSMPLRAWIHEMPESPEKTHCLGLIDQRIRELDTPTTANDLQVDEDASISMKPAASIGVAYILGAILLLCFSLALGYRSLQSGNVTEIGSAA